MHQSSPPNRALDAALRYAQMGISVIRLRPDHDERNLDECNKKGVVAEGHACPAPQGLGSKKPQGSWLEFMSRRASEDDLRQMFDGTAQYGVGLLMGAISAPPGKSLICLDFDGPNSYKELLGGVDGVPGGQTWVASTGREGGGHHVYLYVNGERPKTHIHIVGERVDVLTTGCYTAVEPTVHPATHRRYRWERQPEKIFDVGMTLEQFLASKGAALADEVCLICHPQASQALVTNRPQALVDVVARGTTVQGSRHEAAAQYAGRIVRALRYEQALQVLADWNQLHCEPPLPDHELAQIVRDLATKDELGQPEQPRLLLMRELVAQVRPTIAQRFIDPTAAMGITTGHEQFDQRSMGMLPATTITVAGRPGTYKTALTFDMALRQAETGVGVAYFSLEMHPGQLLGRQMQAHVQRTMQQVIKSGVGITAEQQRRMHEVFEDWRRLPLYLDGNSSASPDYIEHTLNALADKLDVRIVYVDYLQLVRLGGNETSFGRVDYIGRIIQMLADIAKRRGLTMVVLAQLNRESAKADREPELYDLRDSGDIEQRSDVVWLLQKLKHEDTGLAEDVVRLHIKKNKYGQAGESAEFRVSPWQPIREHLAGLHAVTSPQAPPAHAARASF
jgi:replicative DNA helicase